MILYIQKLPKESTINLPEVTNKFSKVTSHKINIQNYLCFYTVTVDNLKWKLIKKLHLQ